jgi:hypothetical protein
LQRHWDITPFSTGPATITIYIQQSEFDAYNAFVSPATPKMPTGSSDIAGISNITVMQCHGVSTTFLPGSYSGATQMTTSPGFTMVWNVISNVWELTLPVTNFSGIFLLTIPTVQLPVELTSFKGSFNEDESMVELSWNTASESNCKEFQVQRLNANNTYETIGIVAGSGNSVAPHAYNFKDENYTLGYNYYRLNQIDFDGKSNPSTVISIKVTKDEHTFVEKNSLKAWINQEKLTIESDVDVAFKVYALNGTLVLSSDGSFNKTYSLDVADWQKGMYVVYTKDVNENVVSKKIIR